MTIIMSQTLTFIRFLHVAKQLFHECMHELKNMTETPPKCNSLGCNFMGSASGGREREKKY